MDEFKDLDREIMRLKKEFDAHNDILRELPLRDLPDVSDYWRRRLDEEKVLFSKKLSAREEEKKALEARIAQQQEQIDQYHRDVEGVERRFEEEARQWEDRLRIKEAELVVEKNRLLYEEKVKTADLENKALLGRIGELNAKINEIKEAHEAERKQAEEAFAHERQGYEERLAAGMREREGLQEKAAGLSKIIDETKAAVAALEAAHEARVREYDDKMRKLDEEKSAAGREAAEQRRLYEEEAKARRKTDETFLRELQYALGSLSALVQGMFPRRKKGSRGELLKELVQKIDSDTDAFAQGAGFLPRHGRPFTACVVMDNPDLTLWHPALSAAGAQVQQVAERTLVKELERLKPQVLVLSGRWRGKAGAVLRRLPFLPVVVAGALAPRAEKRLLAVGASVVKPPYVAEEIADVCLRAVSRSMAWPEYWGRVRPRSRRGAALSFALALLFCIAVAAFFPVEKISLPGVLRRSAAYTTPYLRPTSLAFDGRSLWACDWFGQSVYQHANDRHLTLVRVFYFPAKHLTALAWAGGELWSADPWEAKIYRHNADENLSVVASFPAPGSALTGLASDGAVLWSCDGVKGEIYRHRIDDKLSVASTVKSPGPNPAGLYYDGDSLWSVDARTNRIYRHTADESLRVIETFVSPVYGEKGHSISGIVRRENDIWICSEKSGRIYRYPRSLLKKVG